MTITKDEKELPDYHKIISDFVEVCKRILGDDLQTIILWRGVARGDYTPYLSDIDILIVIKSAAWKEEKREGIVFISREILEKNKRIVEEVAEKNPWLKEVAKFSGGVPIESIPITEDIIKHGKEPLAHIFNPIGLNALMNCYKILYGEDILRVFQPPKITKEDSLQSFNEVKRTIAIHEKKKNREPYGQGMVYIKNALLCAEAFLHYHNIHKFSPKEVLDTFKAELPDFPNLSYLEDCYWAKVHWPEIMHKNDYLLSLADKAKTFIQTVLKHVP